MTEFVTTTKRINQGYYFMINVKDVFQRGLIVSCQALKNEPLYGSDIMARMAFAALSGGAVGIRANTPCDIVAIKKAVQLPLIGIYKVDLPDYEVYITPTFDSAKEVAKAGADMIAVEATNRTRPEPLDQLIGRIKDELGKPVMADCSTFEEAMQAAKFGADIISTTMAGYTAYTSKTEGPDFDLLIKMLDANVAPVIAEGRFYYPEQVVKALELGAHAVVVGGAITRPAEITTRFVNAINKAKEANN